MYFGRFTCMFEVIILHEYKFLIHKLRSWWDPVLQQYALRVGLIQFILHQVQIPTLQLATPPHHNRASSMVYGWCDSDDCSSFINPFVAQRPSYMNQRFRTDSSVQMTLFHCSIIQSLYAIGIFWHCLASSTTVSWQQFCLNDQL